jgi:hypothetical protein
MDSKKAKTRLGLSATATADSVEATYVRRSKVLKRRLVEAGTVEERERVRSELKNLVYLRDIALGPEAAAAYREERQRRKERREQNKDWWSPSTGIPERIQTRESALVFFGLGSDASTEEIRHGFFQRSRALKREIAHAQTDADLQFFQNTLRRLNELLRLCFEPPTHQEYDAADDVLADLDATHTEVGALFEEPEPEEGPELELEEEEEDEGVKPQLSLSDSVWDINIESTSLKGLRRRDAENDS